MDFDVLKTELDAGHPVTGVYDPVDAIAADQLNAVNRTRVKTSMTGDAIFAATDATEFAGVSEHKRIVWLALCGRAENDPPGAANIALVNWIFGSSSETLDALAAARKEDISRAVELGFGHVQAGDVQQARALQ